MQTSESLAQVLSSAYEQLYDIAALRSHPVGAVLPVQADTTDTAKDRAWQIHHALIKMIDELNPGGRAPAMSREWRKHRLMRMRYVDGLSPQEVADALAVSRRQYYRVHDEAMHYLAEIVMAEGTAAPRPPEPERRQLLRAEAERHGRGSQRAELHAVVESALSLLQDRLSQRGVRAQWDATVSLPALRADEKLFRQLLLSVMDFLVERSRYAKLEVSARSAADGVEVALRISPALAAIEAPVAAFDELAALNGARVLPVVESDSLRGFVIRQPALQGARAETVLVVDDNEDTLELYRRYLEPRHVNVMAARNSAQVFDALLDARPSVIFLDLMLPEQDGWDILQLLKSEPDARDIPVFICSVLKQQELALSLGATGFIEKPFTREALLTALESARRP